MKLISEIFVSEINLSVCMTLMYHEIFQNFMKLYQV